jgi:4-methyl-5(b-hydroxyethyl)-thiazole monophosphate biosynthesis
MACKVLVLLAKGFETMEFSPFIDVMGWARNDYDYDIITETCGYTREVISTFGIPVRVDKLLSEVNVDDYAALAIPGGFEEYGFYEEAYDEPFLELIQSFDAKGKLIASICVGALPLGKSGVLKGRRATTYHLRQGYRMKQLEAFGVTVINEPIVLDHNIITSYCPQTAPGVVFLLLELLTTKEFAITVKTAMGFE